MGQKLPSLFDQFCCWHCLQAAKPQAEKSKNRGGENFGNWTEVDENQGDFETPMDEDVDDNATSSLQKEGEEEDDEVKVKVTT